MKLPSEKGPGIILPAQRRQFLLKYLEEHESVTIREAAQLCRVSEATARRDLDDMAAETLLDRTHGGAILHMGTSFERVHSEKANYFIEEKKRIAAEAARLIQKGNSIFLDSGTTVFCLAKAIVDIPQLTIITNNLEIAYNVTFHETSSVILTGGQIRYDYRSLVGTLAEDVLKGIHTDFSFMGGDAISAESGLYNANYAEVGTKKAMCACGGTTVLLCDHSKFDCRSLAKICGWDQIDILITDSDIDHDTAEKVRKKIQKLILA